MNTTLLNVTRLNVTELNVTRLNSEGLAGMGKKGGGMEAAIRRSMVLWYDIARQGCTNESMAANPVLKDLSGNGHDATCYNFAWSGMSGIGGYVADPLYNNTYNQNGGVVSKDGYTITLTHTSAPSLTFYEYTILAGRTIPTHHIRVTGLNGLVMTGTNLFSNITINEDGIYTLPEVFSDVIAYAGFRIVDIDIDCNISVELLPEYPNAIVADGVDDYAYVEGMPILTDYTVIAKRTIFEGSAGAIAAKSAERGLGINVEFVFEGGTKFVSNTFSFGTADNVSITNEDISWQTKSSYNGTKIDYGKINGGTILDIFGYKYATAALYSLLLFDRTLSQEEIEWVKENLIEGKTITM